MIRNKIQLQYGLSLKEFHEIFPDEEACRLYLQKTKWPCGFHCRQCGKTKAWVVYRRKIKLPSWRCRHCQAEESLYAHTLFEYTRLPLTTWFMAIELLTQAKTCMSALELHRLLHVNDKTALLLKHKIMEATREFEQDRVLHQRIEIDDIYLGGIAKGTKSGRGAAKKHHSSRRWKQMKSIVPNISCSHLSLGLLARLLSNGLCNISHQGAVF